MSGSQRPIIRLQTEEPEKIDEVAKAMNVSQYILLEFRILKI